MIPFLFLFIFRALSGLQNGLGYGHRKQARFAVTIIMLIALSAAAVYFFLRHPPDWRTCLALGGIIVSWIGSFAVEDNFSKKVNLFKQDIHLWELMATGGVVFSWTIQGGDLIGIACSIYPGLILHKGFVNILSGHNWWYHGTDDVSGKTFGIPSLGISIRRLPLKVRLIMAISSLLIITITSILHFRICLYDLI